MRVTGNVRDFVLDQLAGLDGLRARAMFGGVGLYAGEVFFGIVAADVLYFKVDDSTRAAVRGCGLDAFQAVRRPGDDDALLRRTRGSAGVGAHADCLGAPRRGRGTPERPGAGSRKPEAYFNASASNATLSA